MVGYGSGHIRLFSLSTGHIMCEISAHNGWITGMDLASHSGLLLSCAEDSYVRVWQLNTKGPLVEHWFSSPIHDCLMTGAKFLDPRGSSFCIASYDSSSIQVMSKFFVWMFILISLIMGKTSAINFLCDTMIMLIFDNFLKTF